MNNFRIDELYDQSRYSDIQALYRLTNTSSDVDLVGKYVRKRDLILARIGAFVTLGYDYGKRLRSSLVYRPRAVTSAKRPVSKNTVKYKQKSSETFQPSIGSRQDDELFDLNSFVTYSKYLFSRKYRENNYEVEISDWVADWKETRPLAKSEISRRCYNSTLMFRLALLLLEHIYFCYISSPIVKAIEFLIKILSDNFKE
ncbi:hypothetical protein [Rubellicoccus peritrichatus]|uniref:Uncharacterized protein n=1 Tax=Rubellicoccus peritrichatus TaxID=3080537 RepID=A0AAQ3LG01_9BACT|nr:hypothetical protein [Puniceicoccus sp. CR14]WOO43123.1 hypothetical protein RZN69_08460 [Puniceicoccus sp. CR14]